MEEAKLLPAGVDDQGDLPGMGEKVAVDEQVISGQKNAEAGMRVLPAEDFGAGKLRLGLAMQIGPGFVGECE